MIFVTVGTEKYPFDRLLRIVDDAVGAGIIQGPGFAQTGCSTYRPRHLRFQPLIGFDEMRQRVREADLVIGHAGVGTIVLALNQGRVPLVMPRRADLREHISDHQIDFALRLDDCGKIILFQNENEFRNKVNRLKPTAETTSFRAKPSQARKDLIDYLRATLFS